MYNFNLLKHINDNLLATLRSNSVRQFFYVLLFPFISIHNLFIALRVQANTSLSYNMQYPSLQRLLNDRFDNNLRRIRVYDSSSALAINIDAIADDTNHIATPFNICDPWTITHSGFTVELPNILYINQNIINQVTKLVNNYKFLSMHYQIIETILI